MTMTIAVNNNTIKPQPQLHIIVSLGWTKDHGSACSNYTNKVLKFQFNLPSMVYNIFIKNVIKLTCLKLLYVTRQAIMLDIWCNYNDDEIILNKLDERFFFVISFSVTVSVYIK